MNKSLVILSVVGYLTLSITAGATTVINFDDLTPDHNANFGPNFAIPPANYHGLTWTNTIVEAASTFIPGSLNLNVSVPNVATDSNYLGFSLNAAPIQIASVSSFTFNSAYFIANQVQGLTVHVQGILNGIIVDTQSFTVGTLAPMLGIFNWTNVDTIIMSTSGGIDPTKHKSFTFDNLVINAPVPETSSYLLCLIGLGVVSAAARRRR